MMPQTVDGPLELERIYLRRGYDSAGRYYGVGAPLFRAYDQDGGYFEFRARDRGAAKTQLRAKYPGVRFAEGKARRRHVGSARRPTTRRRRRTWTAAVSKRATWHPPRGLFTRSPMEIASYLARHSSGLKQAMARLTFYETRGGTTISPRRRADLELAKDLLRQMY